MYRRILVPLDGSPLAEEVLEPAVAIARGTTTPMHLLWVVDLSLITSPRGNFQLNWDDILVRAKDNADEYLTSIGSRIQDSGLSVTHSVEEGDPASVIIAQAAEQPDTLVAMCTRGRSGPSRWLLGSVSDKTVRQGEGPVLLVSSQGGRSSDEGVRDHRIAAGRIESGGGGDPARN